jgi:hypothetical protein
MPLEGLRWADDMTRFSASGRSPRQWTMMVMQPEWVTAPLVEEAMREVAGTKRGGALDRVRCESLAEGHCAQPLHVGPFTGEGPAVRRVHEFIEQSGARLSGRHHEICLSEIRRVEPASWHTSIRQPMR